KCRGVFARTPGQDCPGGNRGRSEGTGRCRTECCSKITSAERRLRASVSVPVVPGGGYVTPPQKLYALRALQRKRRNARPTFIVVVNHLDAPFIGVSWSSSTQLPRRVRPGYRRRCALLMSAPIWSRDESTHESSRIALVWMDMWTMPRSSGLLAQHARRREMRLAPGGKHGDGKKNSSTPLLYADWGGGRKSCIPWGVLRMRCTSLHWRNWR